MHDRVEDDAAAGPPQPRAQEPEHAHAGHRRRQRRHLEHRPREPLLQLAPDGPRLVDAEHGRERDELVGAQPRHQRRLHLRPEAGSSNARAKPSELTSARPSGTRSSSTARAVMPPRARLSASSGAWKSFSARKPTTHTSPPSRRSPAAIVSGTTADGLSAPTAVGSSRFCSRSPVYGYAPSIALLNHSIAAATPSRPTAAYGWPSPSPAERLARPLDPLGRVAEHVDRARAEVRGPDALGQHEHAGALLGEPHRGGQPRQPGARDDDVVVTHRGTCSTSSSPWKIQSSSRAWRSWSPYRIGHTPFQRSCRKPRSEPVASAPSSRSTACRMPVAR